MLSLVRNNAGDILTKSFEHTLPPTASYIRERHFSTFQPLGSNIYSPSQGTKLIRIQLSDGAAFLDPSTVRLAFTLNNNTTAPGADAAATTALGLLKLAAPPLSLIKRIRVLVKGTVVEDIQESGRLSTLLWKFDSTERATNNITESCWGDTLKPAESRRIICPLDIIGLIRQDRHISLYWAPLTFEFELAPGAEAFEGWDGTSAGAAKRTQDYNITDVTILADTLTVSGELQKIFADHMMNGQMPFAISTWSNTRHEVPATRNFDLQTTRSISLLKTAFLTFDVGGGANDWKGRLVGNKPGTSTAYTDADRAVLTNATALFNPQMGKKLNIAEDTMEWQMVIGARVWPVMPCRGLGETYMRLRQALDLNRYGQLNISKADYQTSSFVIGCDVEKAAGTIDGANFSGHVCRSNDAITVRIRNLDNAHTPGLRTSTSATTSSSM
jgi:hypothetical protein